MNPFHLLGVEETADDEEIRRTYLDAVKSCPPERDGERFAALTRAYDTVKDKRSRCEYILFNRECPGDSPLDALVQWARVRTVPRPIPFEAMKDFLRKCGK
jgi:curved DNA-binding protein CbpA